MSAAPTTITVTRLFKLWCKTKRRKTFQTQHALEFFLEHRERLHPLLYPDVHKLLREKKLID
jgi:hypothetical protein